MKYELLIATNGFKGTWTAIEYGAWLNYRSKVSLLGVTGNGTSGRRRSPSPGEFLASRRVVPKRAWNTTRTRKEMEQIILKADQEISLWL
jgi:hypothetical protein